MIQKKKHTTVPPFLQKKYYTPVQALFFSHEEIRQSYTYKSIVVWILQHFFFPPRQKKQQILFAPILFVLSFFFFSSSIFRSMTDTKIASVPLVVPLEKQVGPPTSKLSSKLVSSSSSSSSSSISSSALHSNNVSTTPISTVVNGRSRYEDVVTLAFIPKPYQSALEHLGNYIFQWTREVLYILRFCAWLQIPGSEENRSPILLECEEWCRQQQALHPFEANALLDFTSSSSAVSQCFFRLGELYPFVLALESSITPRARSQKTLFYPCLNDIKKHLQKPYAKIFGSFLPAFLTRVMTIVKNGPVRNGPTPRSPLVQLDHKHPMTPLKSKLTTLPFPPNIKEEKLAATQKARTNKERPSTKTKRKLEWPPTLTDTLDSSPLETLNPGLSFESSSSSSSFASASISSSSSLSSSPSASKKSKIPLTPVVKIACV